jgi:galactokinase
MDQAASTLCQADHALFLDCRSFETRQVPIDLGAAGLEILVLDTKTPHALVDSEYATRRASCEAAAAILGVAALRDVEVTGLDDALGRLEDEEMRRRVRHVVTENARVLEAADVLGQRRIAALAPLLDASHASMRDDFEITVPTVDLAVETARSAGALGVRPTPWQQRSVPRSPTRATACRPISSGFRRRARAGLADRHAFVPVP